MNTMDILKTREYKILILEDSSTDAELMERELRKGGLKFVSKVVSTKDDFSNALDTFIPDIILADFKLPGFDGLSALKIAKEKRPAYPFILVTGEMREEDAVLSLKNGAIDYILKSNLTRLESAVKRALADVQKTNKLKSSEGAEQMNKFMIGRESKMADLKEEIKELKNKLGEE